MMVRMVVVDEVKRSITRLCERERREV